MQQLILIVDDDAKFLKFLADMLQADGHATLTAENGERAIATARSAKPALMRFSDLTLGSVAEILHFA